MEFQPFPKIVRWCREVIVTEKIDGTNGQIYIAPKTDYGCLANPNGWETEYIVGESDEHVMFAGSRTRWITPGKQDNFGFAGWVAANASALFALGPGHHFGEWWGLGIQRSYGLTEKRFSLFNTNRWGPHRNQEKYPEDAPLCCQVVPVIAIGDHSAVKFALEELDRCGSFAAPGFMNPEGIVVFHTASGVPYKVTREGDGHKSPR